MSGGVSVGGLVSGLDTNAIVEQLMALERQPLLRLEAKVSTLESQKDSLTDLRTQLLSLRDLIQDFQFGLNFSQFEAIAGTDSVLGGTLSGANPTVGTFQIEVLQLASATVANSSAPMGAAINTGAALSSSGIATEISAGTFTINGVEFNVDPAVDSLTGIMNTINASSAGVTATYDAVSDTISIENSAANDTSIINFGATGDTSNLLDVLKVDKATQLTGGNGSTVATSTGNLGAINQGSVLNTVNFAGGAVTAGSFQINGVSITVDPTVDAVTDVVDRINQSDAGVTASYDPTTDSIRVVSDSLGSRTISFTSGTSNFLDVTNLTGATQTAGTDAEYTVDGGAVQTSNSNDVANAIAGVTISLKSVGTSSLTVDVDDEAITESVQGFVDTFNESFMAILDLVGDEGDFENDASLRSIASFLQQNVFALVPGLGSNLESLLNIGISTGDSFDPAAPFQLSLDGEALSAAILDNREGVQDLFTNDDGTGVMDLMFDYMDEITSSTGFLNERTKSNGSIDDQIASLNDRIESMERRLEQREQRLRNQFLMMETMVNSLQTQGSSLAALGSGLGSF